MENRKSQLGFICHDHSNVILIEPVPVDLLYDESSIKIMAEMESLRNKQLLHHKELFSLSSGIWTKSQISTSSFPYPIRRAEFPWAIEKSHLAGSMKILDVGSGLSLFTVYLASKGHQVYSIDNDEVIIKQIAPRLADWADTHVNYIQGDVLKIQFEDNSFDQVFCISVLEHLEEEVVDGKYVSYKKRNLDVKAISEMLRVLKPGGLLILTLEWSEVPEEQRSYKLQDIYGRLLKDYRSNLLIDEKPELNWNELNKKYQEAWKSFPPFYYVIDSWAMGIVLKK